MKETELKFKANDNPAIVAMSEKQHSEVKKAHNELHFAVKELASRIDSNTLEEGFKETLCSLIETYAQRLTGALGYEGQLKKEFEERYAEIRQRNEENRQLRKQLGEKVSPEDVREALKNMRERFRSWWNVEGFGFCKDEIFAGYGFTATLSGSITHAYYANTSISEEEKVQIMTGKGFEISDKYIIGNDSNIALLTSMLKSKYPSCEIDSIKTNYYRGCCQVWDINIRITNFDELG